MRRLCPKCGDDYRYKSGRCRPCTLAINNRWKKENRADHIAASAKWQKENSERRSVARLVFIASNPERATQVAERVARNAAAWRKANPSRHAIYQQKRRALKATVGGSFTSSEWFALCEYFGNKCLACACEPPTLTADHIIPLSRGGSNGIENIQPLCGPCNSRKGCRTIDYRASAAA